MPALDEMHCPPAPDSGPPCDSVPQERVERALDAKGWIWAAPRALMPVGVAEGFTGGRLFRLTLGRTPRCPAPRSVVAKLGPKNPELCQKMRAQNTAEVAFYRHIAPRHPLPVPICFSAEGNGGTGDSLLLLQDLSHHHRHSLTEGCPLPQAQAAVRALAQVHAAHWHSGAHHPALSLLLPPAPEFIHSLDLSGSWPIYPTALSRLLQDFDLPAWFLPLCKAVEGLEGLLSQRMFAKGPVTLLHRDAHIENLLFDPATGRATLLDWQFTGLGRAGLDVGYFLISSLPPALRRAKETALLALYHHALARPDYSVADLHADYRLAAILKLWLSVMATLRFDNEGPTRRAYRRADLTRLLAFCEDHALTASAVADLL